MNFIFLSILRDMVMSADLHSGSCRFYMHIITNTVFTLHRFAHLIIYLSCNILIIRDIAALVTFL